MQSNSATSSPIVKEVILNAPIEKVWKALTDKEEMKKWYFDIADFKPEVGFTFSFFGEKDGRKFIHICTIQEVEINKKLSYTWTYEGIKGETIVHFQLFPESNQTRLRLTHEGLENLPQNEDYAKSNFEEGWNYIIGTSIKNYIAPNE
jgi:uncharacterized protein YndB with AHSA1/START domain